MNPAFEERYRVQVDTRIPEEERLALYQHWEDLKERKDKRFASLDKCNLMSRVEHMIIGSTVGFPYDPFRPLAALARNADVQKVRYARRKMYEEGKALRFFPSMMYKKFEEITGLDHLDYDIEVEKPEMDSNGRVPFPRVVAVYSGEGERMPLKEGVLEQIQFPTTRKVKLLGIGTLVNEIFDFDNGYRIELVEGEEE